MAHKKKRKYIQRRKYERQESKCREEKAIKHGHLEASIGYGNDNRIDI